MNKNLIKIAGFGAGLAGAQIVFGVFVASVIIGIIIGFVAVPIYKNHLQKKRQRMILLQFRDVLDSLSNSFSAGRNTMGAFSDAYNDLKNAYGDKAPMVKELNIVVNGLASNFIIEDLLKDMASRCYKQLCRNIFGLQSLGRKLEKNSR